MYASLSRASRTWRKVVISELELQQIDELQRELEEQSFMLINPRCATMRRGFMGTFLKAASKAQCLCFKPMSCFCGVLALTSFSPVVLAQESAMLEEVVVTARKRGAESLQNIGGSIQAIGGDALAAKAAVGFNDYMRSVPSLGTNNSGTGQTQLTMRGINTTRLNHANPNVPSTVGVFFDETPLTTSGFEPDASLVDIDRIEVLRGPQGTLFGASSMSGMIRIIPKAPDFEKFTVDGGFSGFHTDDGGPSYSGHAVLNIPVTDAFAARIVGFNISNGGFIDNVYRFGTDDDYNSENIYGGRFTGLWTATDSLTLKGTIAYQNSHADGRPDEYIPFDPVAGVGLATGDSILVTGEQLSQFQVTDELQTSKILDDTYDDETWFAALQADLDLGDRARVTSVTSYSDRRMFNLLDDAVRFRDIFLSVGANCAVGAGPCLGANLEIPISVVPFHNRTAMDRFSQDLRANIDITDSVSAVVGVYYEDETRKFEQDIPILGLDAWHVAIGNFGGFVPVSLADEAQGVDNGFDGVFDVGTRQYAFYGEASIELGDFELIGGLRYFDYKQDAFIRWVGWIEFGDDILDATIEDSDINPKAEIIYRATDDLLFYANAAKGFRLGSVQQFIHPVFCAAELAALGVTQIPTTIENDSLWNYEGGVKTTLFGGTTTANVSAYYIDWKDARTQVFLACGWIPEFNDIQIESEGVELELASRLTDSLAVNFGVGYNDAQLSEPALSINGQKGDPTPYAPEWTVNAGFDFVLPRAVGDWDWFLRADASYVSKQFTELGTGTSLARHTIPSSTTANLYTGFGGERWDVTFFARNLTNEEIVTGADIDRRQPLQFSRGRPRNFGVSFRFSM